MPRSPPPPVDARAGEQGCRDRGRSAVQFTTALMRNATNDKTSAKNLRVQSVHDIKRDYI